MTRDEQRAMLAKAMCKAYHESLYGGTSQWLAVFDAIAEAGACVNWPGATLEMFEAASKAEYNELFRAMALAGNLAGKDPSK